MTTTMPKVRVMKDEELTTPAQLECRLAQLRGELTGNGDKLKTVRRINALKERISPSGIKPAIPAILLVSKADVAEWGDRQAQQARK